MTDLATTHGVEAAQPARARSQARPGLPGRALVIALTSALYLSVGVFLAVPLWLARGRTAGLRRLFRTVTLLLQRLGPTFVKLGQIMSVRRDALPPALCEELAVLHDAVTPMTPPEIRRALGDAYAARPEPPFRYDQLTAVASGSIASVFRAPWREGLEVAVKLQRPGIARVMEADLALMQAFVRLAERLPKCKGMPLGDLTAYVSTAILGQLDFEREATNLRRLRSDLASIPGIQVPSVVEEASVLRCLVMEFIPGLSASNVAMHTPETRARLAVAVLYAVRQMIFVHGFVHCDLHPGNLYVTREGQVVILDAGFSAHLPDPVRRLIAEFFTQLSAGNGRRCAEIIIESAANRPQRSDLESFVSAVVALVQSQAGPANPGFAMMRFGNSLFDLQREYGLYAQSDFVFPLMSLAVVESSVKMLSPELDFQEFGRLRSPVGFGSAPGCALPTGGGLGAPDIGSIAGSVGAAECGQQKGRQYERVES